MIPAAQSAWRPQAALPLAAWHPAAVSGGVVLAVLWALLVPAVWLVPLAGLLAWLLKGAGWRPGYGWRLLRLWAPLLLVVLAAHTVSAADAAAIGRPSWTGFGRGLLALGRLGLMLGAVGLGRRLLPLPRVGEALAWWARPWRRLGADVDQLNLVLAVAAGTAPRTLAEASRLHACLRLRCADGRTRRRRWHLRERWLVVPPLMEGLARRAESLPLALAGRTGAAPAATPLPAGQAAVLIGWAVVLALLVGLAARGGAVAA